MRRWMLTSLMVFVTWAGWPMTGHSSSPQKVELNGFKSWSEGKLNGLGINSAGHLATGPLLRRLAQDIPGPMTHAVRRSDGTLFYATASPARIWQLSPKGETKRLLELDRPLVTRLALADKSTLVALSGPEGGVHFIPIAKPWQAKFVPIKNVHLLADVVLTDFGVFVVGGGHEGRLLQVERKSGRVKSLLELEDSILSTVIAWPNKRETLVLGSGSGGRIFEYSKGKLTALYQSEGQEVTSLLFDGDNHLVAGFAGEESALSEGGTARDRKTDKAKKRKGNKSSGLSEVVRVMADGRVEMLWQSKQDQVHDVTLAKSGDTLLVATGPNGRVFAVDAKGERAAGIWTEVPEHNEVTQIIAADSQNYMMTTVNPNAIWRADGSRTEALGLFTSAVLDAGAHAHIGRVSWQQAGSSDLTVKVRTGKSSNPNEGWHDYSQPIQEAQNIKVTPGRYFQAQVQVNNEKKAGRELLSGLSIHYLLHNRAPEIDKVMVSPPNVSTWRTFPSVDTTSGVTFDKDAYEELPDSLKKKKKKLKGKVRHTPGYRTFHVVAEDPDKDKMRYRFSLVRLGQSKPKPVQETPWSENPFWSLDTTHLATGDYRVQVDVDDVLSNGRERAKQDTDATLPFAVSHRNPTILREGNGLKSGKVHFQVKGHKAQLVEATCRLGDAWLPVMPKDGILDDSEEHFEVDVAGQMALTCRFSDEAGNSTQEEVWSSSF